MLPPVNLVRTTDTDYLLFPAADMVSRSIYERGTWEANTIKLSQLIIREATAPVVLDIGANLGAYSVPMGQYLQPKEGKVYAFEPQRIVYYQLCANVFLNRLDNVYTFHQALGNRQELIQIPKIDYHRHTNIGAFSLEKSYREHHQIEQFMQAQTESVPMCRLDDMTFDGRIALIKIDVEGYELNVLQGATALLEAHGYPPILFELWQFPWFEQQRAELLNWFQKLGYETLITGTECIAQHPSHSVRMKAEPSGNAFIFTRLK